MSPRLFANPAAEAADQAETRFWVDLGRAVRDARVARRWDVITLARKAHLSRTVAYEVESGRSRSVAAVTRVVTALGLRLDATLTDPRKHLHISRHTADPVHSYMGEVEAAHLRRLGRPVGIDEPYQHYQFAGRGDLVAWDLDARALLHIENRTRFPDFQDMAGSFNAKRAYLGVTLADRLGVRRWDSETHVIAALWSSEVLHALRLRPESFRALCPDKPDQFRAWWSGAATAPVKTATLIAFDPLASGRERAWISLEKAIDGARPRHRGYADIAAKMAAMD
jgi:hypothetical protein